MNKPDDVSQEAWETAKTKDGLDYKFPVKVIVARAIDAAIAKERERAAKIADPGYERPCDCERCVCFNVGDAVDIAAWDERAFIAERIRSGK